ncbi:MAG: AAA family ATPase, partial [Elusimicrobiota bacterium]|nr:AAA family ATPase [Elusimicrobiota bacterium]
MSRLSRRYLAAAVALAMAAPGPAAAAGVARVSGAVEAGLAPKLAQPGSGPSFSAPSLILSPASLTPSLLAAPAIAPAALAPVAAAAAKLAPREALNVAAVQAAKLTPKMGGAEAKDRAGAAFEGNAERREVASFVSAQGGAGQVHLEINRRSAPAAKAVPPIPAAPATFVSLARKYWLAAATLGAGALLWALGSDTAAGLLPFLGLAGTLAWTPSPGAKAAFLAGIRNAAAPGTVISYEAVGKIGARLGMDADKAGEVFTELLREGHLAVRDNRDAVYHSFRARAEAPGAGPADVLASEAVVLMNSGASADHARAVAKADRAVEAYEKAGAPQLEEAKVLRANAMLEFFSGLLLAHQKDLESRDPLPLPLAKRAMDVAEVREWLQTATYQTGKVPAMSKVLHDKLIALIGSINPQTEAGNAVAEEAADGYIAALDLLEKYDPKDYLYEGPSSKAPAPEGSWKPSAEQTDAFAAEVRARTPAGETLSRETIMRAGKSLGLDTEQMAAAVSALAGRGEVLVLSNGKTVYFDLRDQARDDRDGLWDLHNEAVEAIILLNQAGLENHLRAVARLDALHRRYFDARKSLSVEAKAYQQVLIALANAKLEAASDVVGHQAAANKGDEARLAGLRQAQAWLDHAYYSAERRQRITTASQKALNAAASLPAFRDALGGRTEPLVTQGVMKTRHFLGDMTAEDDETADHDAPAPHPSGWRPLSQGDYPALNKYGIDLTGKAVDGKIPPMIGRKAEMRQIVKTLLRVEKNNPLIIGEKGVGKTAVANGLALLIAKGELPELEGKSVVKLDLTKIVAGTTLRGQFEERMVAILDEAKKSNGRVLLFIAEIHMLVGTGDSAGSTDAANILKESLADGSISVMGATTMEEYRKIEKDGALARRFNAVKLLPPTKDEAEAIVSGVKSRYEDKHKVTIGAETVKAVVALASRYVTDRNLPDSALDLLDDASAEAELSGRAEVTPGDIASEVALRTGIPAGKVGAQEKDQLKDLPKELGGKVVGQAEAVSKVAKGVQRGR